ncbi:MAG: hypothetical protein Q8N00_00350 [Nitrospirota bacterium]|nr:hypothetical protein [Nitrospirota bacterium]MDP3597949.1 hypothetical protein [Nitrospirota bacterium]
MVQDSLVTIRFSTSRATLCGVHLSGVEYAVSREFAKQVVEGEGVAAYVNPEPEMLPGSVQVHVSKRKR